MNNVVMRKIVLTDQFQPLTAKESEVLTVEISAPPTNTGPAIFRGEDGSEVPWNQGEFHSFKSIDLADVWVKGTPGDIVTIVGGAW
jgi:hypothetical protein